MGKLRSVVLFSLFALSPLFAFASVQAGFPQEAVWLSKTSATAGDAVEVYAALYNQSGNTVSGTVIFLVDGKKIGNKEFSLEAGRSALVSILWTSTAGAHTVSASIEGADVASASAGSVKIAVAEPPPPLQAVAAAAVQNAITSIVGSSSPIVATIVNSVGSQTEAVRQAGANFFENRVAADAKSSSAAKNANINGFASADASDSEGQLDAGGDVLGIATERSDTPSFWSGIVTGLDKAGYAIFSSVAFFYPLVAIIILLILYILGKRMRRGYRE